MLKNCLLSVLKTKTTRQGQGTLTLSDSTSFDNKYPELSSLSPSNKICGYVKEKNQCNILTNIKEEYKKEFLAKHVSSDVLGQQDHSRTSRTLLRQQQIQPGLRLCSCSRPNELHCWDAETSRISGRRLVKFQRKPRSTFPQFTR